jgi:hypothetical protein
MDIMGACTHVRAIVMDYPHFWTRISVNGPRQWTDFCTQRTMSSPLSICLDQRKLHAHIDIEAIQTLMKRADTAILYIMGPGMAKDFLDSPMPCLAALCYTFGNVGTCQLSSRFMAGQTMSLSKLVLKRVDITVSGPQLPSLIHMDLHSCGFREPEALPNLIAASPKLKRLYVNRVAYSADQDNVVSREPIPLPCLKFLGFSGNLPAIISILSVLPMPKHDYCMHVDAKRHGPQTNPLRSRAFQSAMTRFGLLGTHIAFTPTVKLYRKPIDRKDYFCLVLEHPEVDVEASNTAYEDHSEYARHLNLIVDVIRTLHVHYNAFSAILFSCTVMPRGFRDPVPGGNETRHLAFPFVDHFVLKDVDRELLYFGLWVSQLKVAGRTVKTVDLKVAKAWLRDLETICELGRTTMVMGVIEQVLINGQPLELEDCEVVGESGREHVR